MDIKKIAYHFIRYKVIFVRVSIGLLTGYLLLHPITMVIYWFELNPSSFSWFNLGKMLSESVIHAFTFQMMPMSITFAVIGAIVGLGSGLYYKIIEEKEYKLHGKGQLLKQSIPSLIANGENEYVEFKSSLRYDYRQVKTDKNLEDIILKSIAGFLNAKGGTLILGVDDSGEILGLTEDYWTLKRKNKDGFQQKLIQLISNAFGKDICSKIHITFNQIKEKEICILLILPSRQPVYVTEGNHTIFFLRTGNVTNPLTTSETVKYLQTR